MPFNVLVRKICSLGACRRLVRTQLKGKHFTEGDLVSLAIHSGSDSTLNL